MMFFKKKCPHCSEKLEKDARFCPKCGEPTSVKGVACPKCGKEIPGDSKFCGFCGANIEEMGVREQKLENKRWKRDARDIAVRVEEGEIKGFLAPIHRGVVIEHGCKGLLVQGGKIVAELAPGYYDQDGWAKRIATLNLAAPTSLVMVADTAEEIEFAFQNLLTAENVKLEQVKCQAVFRVEQPGLFFAEALRGQARYTREDLRAYIEPQLLNVLQTALRGENVMELYGSLDVRQKLEQSMMTYLRGSLERFGIALLQLRFVDYLSSALNEIRDQHPELFKMAEQEKIEGRKDEIERDTIRRQSLRELFEAKTEQEKTALLRELMEKDLLSDQHKFQLERAIAEEREDYRFARELFEQEHGHELERIDKEFKRQESLKDKQHEASLADVERDTDLKDAMQGLDILDRTKSLSRKDEEERRRIDREDTLARERAKAELIKEMAAVSTEALISFTDNAERAKLLAQLHMSEEQLLALQAGGSKDVAMALAEKYKSMNLAKMEEIYKGLLAEKTGFEDRMQQMFNKALETQRDAAGTGIVGTTVVSSGGGMMGMMGGYGMETAALGARGGRSARGRECPSCGEAVSGDSKYCSHCGKAI